MDILVAGFCCVDFSKLNVKRRTIALQDRGESGDTLFAILDFVEKQRPKLVLLENVMGAPWEDEKVRIKHMKTLLDKKTIPKNLTRKEEQELNTKIDEGIAQHRFWVGIDKHMQNIGYAAAFIKLDAKDYFIPQTRQRGYMLCVDLGLFGSPYGSVEPGTSKRKAKDEQTQEEVAMKEAMSYLAEWKTKVEGLSHKATVPAEQLLQAAMDMVSSPISHVEEVAEDKKLHAWVACKALMDKYREDIQLGQERKLTLWNEAGYKLLPDYWTKNAGLTQRVLDVLDIAHLRNIRRGFDDRYYSRFLELSQNVYRVTDTTKSGIIPCLTPSGIPWWTSAGRRIRGRESLLMQGLPVNRMDLSYLSEGNMQDLTGNAMTSTVVASAMLAAFSTFHDQLNSAGQTTPTVETNPSLEIEPVDSTPVNPAKILQPISADKAKLLAKRTSQLCVCEGSYSMLDKLFYRCTICAHTVCIDHRGNCKHDYKAIRAEASGRVNPSKFISQIKDSVPRLINLPVGLSANLQAIFEKEKACTDSGLTVDDVRTVDEYPLLLASFTRSSFWEIAYESSRARLVLEIAAHRVEWLLYAKSPAHLPLTDRTRDYRQRFPLARLLPTGDDITDGAWEVWKPNKVATPLTLEFSGKLIPSFESSRGLAQFVDTEVFDTITISGGSGLEHELEAIMEGRYKASPVCGQAFNSLYVRDTSGGQQTQPSLFFMFDHQPQTGNPKDHCYVFTENINKLPFGMHRQIVASLASAFEIPMIRESPSEHFQTTNRVKILNGLNSKAENKKPRFTDVETVITSHGSWVSTESSLRVGRFPRTNDLESTHDFSKWDNLSCQIFRRVFQGRVQVPNDSARDFVKDASTVVSQRNEAVFFGRFGNMFNRELTLQPHIEEHEVWLESATTADNCSSCAPKQPQILWTWENDMPKPFEDLKVSYQPEISTSGKTFTYAAFCNLAHFGLRGRVETPPIANPGCVSDHFQQHIRVHCPHQPGNFGPPRDISFIGCGRIQQYSHLLETCYR